MSNANYDKVFNRALKILGYRARSIAEMRERLLSKGDPSREIVDRVINRLIELGYLNDEDFAVNYATNKLNVKALGRVRLRRNLTNKKVPADVTDRALDTVFQEQHEEDLCETAIAKHVRLHGKPMDAKGTKKLFGYLIRLGFPYDVVMKKIRASASADVDIVDNE